MCDFDNANERVPEYIQAIADGFTCLVLPGRFGSGTSL
jgi:hypothetical protein